MADIVQDFIHIENSECSISGDVDSPPSNDDILRILECPVCSEYPTCPIYSCAKGHFSCNSCIGILSACTICESPFTKVRNYALEAIVEEIKFKCKFKNLGCDKIIKGCDYLKHSANCSYGNLQCPEENCNSDCSPEGYLNHLRLSHGAFDCEYLMDTPIRGRFVQKLEKKNYPSVFFKHPDNSAILLHTRKYKSFVCWWASCLNPQKSQDAILTWSKIPEEEHSSLEESFVIKWKIPIHDANKGFDFIRDNGTCAVLPIQHLNQFQTKDNAKSWIITVEILKNDMNSKALMENNESKVWNPLVHYSPLLLLIFIGVLLCLFYGSQDDVNSNNLNESEENYFGYRGFYYPKIQKSRPNGYEEF